MYTRQGTSTYPRLWHWITSAKERLQQQVSSWKIEFHLQMTQQANTVHFRKHLWTVHHKIMPCYKQHYSWTVLMYQICIACLRQQLFFQQTAGLAQDLGLGGLHLSFQWGLLLPQWLYFTPSPFPMQQHIYIYMHLFIVRVKTQSKTWDQVF